jgi:tetratricopeptide (TPR) repeat protein
VGYRFSILGPTALRVGDNLNSDWQHAKPRGILAVLLLHPGQAVSIETITRWVWPLGYGPPKPDTFQRYAQRIKDGLRLLEPEPVLRSRNGALRLEVDRDEVDYWWLRAAVERGGDLIESGEHGQAYELLSRAVRLWTSRPFADLQGQPAEHRRWRAETDLWVPAYDLLLRSLDGLGKSQEMLHRLDDLPFDHRGHYRLAVHRVKALYAVGRQRDAMSYVHEARRQLLADEEIDAADELLKQHDLLRQDTDGVLLVTRNGTGSSYRLSPDMLPQDVEFVGRVDLLETLRAQTTGSSGEPGRGVVIIDGPPGVGKSTLAIHWAHQIRHRFPGGVLFANLSGYSDRMVVDPALVVDEFLIAMGTTPNETMSPPARELLLSRLLSEQPTLLILDNVRDNAHVRDLVPRLASSQVVITSRRRLTTLGTTVGARRITVGPMTAAEADELLTTQLGAQRALDDEDRARLVARCGGLPVAISVATAHVATSPTAPITEFARQLTPRNLIVDLGDQDGTVNVGALFAQSYESLAESERRLFRLIGLHPGPEIGLGAASACDGRSHQDTSRSLAKLVDAHLVEQPELGRYRAHDLLAEFAALCAETDEPEPLRRAAGERVVRYYLAVAIRAAQAAYPTFLPPPGADDLNPEAVEFSDRSQAQAWFQRERGNLLAAIAYSVERSPEYTYQLVDPVATFCDRFGAYHDSRTIRELAVAATSAINDREGHASALVGLAIVQMQLGEHVSAGQCLQSALRIVEEDGHERGQAATLLHLGRLEAARGDHVAAMAIFHRGLEIARRLDDLEGVCWYHRGLGEVLRLTNQLEKALTYLSQARLVAQQIVDNSAEASILAEISSVLHTLGDDVGARVHGNYAIKIAEAIPDLAVAAQAYTVLAEINCADGQMESAIRNAQRAVDICDQSHNIADKARAVDVLGAIHHAGGEPRRAIQAWRQAVTLHRYAGNATRADLIQTWVDAGGRDVVAEQDGDEPVAR